MIRLVIITFVVTVVIVQVFATKTNHGSNVWPSKFSPTNGRTWDFKPNFDMKWPNSFSNNIKQMKKPFDSLARPEYRPQSIVNSFLNNVSPIIPKQGES